MKIEGSCHCGQVRFSCDAYAPAPFMHCYCSICRKTAGGSGSAINLGAHADTLEVEGREHLGVYHARIDDGDECRISSGQRHFCTGCGSALWLFDPQWPERVHILLDSKANWVQVPQGRHDRHFDAFPEESLEDWHRRQGLLDGGGEGG